MHVLTTPQMPLQPTATLVFDEVLDATACSAMRRFQKRARRAPNCEASIDLRRTRAVGAAAWATLVKAVCDLKRSGHDVTVVAGERLIGLLELTGLARHARIVIVQI
jgi:anti-anti-sigma regulatory factor